MRDAPTLTSLDAHNRLLSLLEELKAWMDKYDVPMPALLAVLAGTKRGPLDFASTLTSYLSRRASAVAFGAEDLALLETLVKLAGKAPVQQAVEMDPTWRYTHDANGAVTSVTVEMPAFVIQGDFGPVVLGPANHTTACYRYDARQRLVQVETLSRVGAAQLAATTPPCEDSARVQLAVFRYDEANRRVYANVAGRETWELRGASGELLAEVSAGGDVERAFVYLDGEPLAMILAKPGTTTRPPSTPLGCATSGNAQVTGGPALLLMLALLVLRRRKQNARRAVLALMVLNLTGCPGWEPVPLPPPGSPPPPGAGDVGPIYYFHNDRQGTPVRMTDSVGTTVWRAEYRPFGDLERLETDVDRDGVHLEQPLRFAGQYDDALSSVLLAQGPYYNWNRNYEPATGRYLSPEPLLQDPSVVSSRAEQGMSMPTYAYASNNPVINVDPDGLLDYRLSCRSPRGAPTRWIHPPGNTYCEDCADVSNSAIDFCSAGLMGTSDTICMCRELQRLADKICQGCQSTQPPPPAPPTPPRRPQRNRDVACN